jgi:hypothetical protein
MKRVIIGGFFMICGTIIIAAIFISASIYCTTLTAWSGENKFWYAILDSSSYQQISYSMNLRIQYFISITMLILGFIILSYEYFNESIKKIIQK